MSTPTYNLRIYMRTAIVLALTFGITACTAYKRIDGVSNTFLEDVDVSKKEPNFPFDHSWVQSTANRTDYDSIYIKPIRLDKLPLNSWTNSSSTVIETESDYKAEAAEIAIYFRQKLNDNIRYNKKAFLKLVDRVEPKTVVMEIALTELEFSHPVARAASLAAPIPGTGAMVGSISDPHVAFAARLTEGDSGKLLATVADRKFPPARIIDLNKLTATSSVREVCRLWADSIAEAIDKGRFVKIEEEATFSWSIW